MNIQDYVNLCQFYYTPGEKNYSYIAEKLHKSVVLLVTPHNFMFNEQQKLPYLLPLISKRTYFIRDPRPHLSSLALKIPNHQLVP